MREAGEKANREFIMDETDCPFFKLGVIQALRYRNPKLLEFEEGERGWLKQVVHAAEKAAADGRRTQPHFMVCACVCRIHGHAYVYSHAQREYTSQKRRHSLGGHSQHMKIHSQEGKRSVCVHMRRRMHGHRQIHIRRHLHLH